MLTYAELKKKKKMSKIKNDEKSEAFHKNERN